MVVSLRMRLVSLRFPMSQQSADIYSLLSCELGRPAMIKEEDCDVRLPNPVDDQYIFEGTNWMTPSAEHATSPFVLTIRVIAGIAELLNLLRSPEIPDHALRAYENHFDKVISEFPTHQHIYLDGYVDPIELPPTMYLQNSRLILYRHNLAPTCDQHTRAQALERCAIVAKGTANILRRCMQDPLPESQAHGEPWEKRMISAVSAFLCTHIWRCTLFLCFRLDFESALTCVRASAVLGDSRRVNISCGQYLDFFLDQLIVKLKEGIDFDTNEEMIAYVSSDLQGSFERSWIWQEWKGHIYMGKPLQSASTANINGVQQQGPDEGIKQHKDGQWVGWERILRLVKGLAREQQQKQDHPESGSSEVARSPAIQLPPLGTSPSPSTSTPRDRMSIKDLL